MFLTRKYFTAKIKRLWTENKFTTQIVEEAPENLLEVRKSQLILKFQKETSRLNTKQIKLLNWGRC